MPQTNAAHGGDRAGAPAHYYQISVVAYPLVSLAMRCRVLTWRRVVPGLVPQQHPPVVCRGQVLQRPISLLLCACWASAGTEVGGGQRGERLHRMHSRDALLHAPPELRPRVHQLRRSVRGGGERRPSCRWPPLSVRGMLRNPTQPAPFSAPQYQGCGFLRLVVGCLCGAARGLVLRCRALTSVCCSQALQGRVTGLQKNTWYRFTMTAHNTAGSSLLGVRSAMLGADAGAATRLLGPLRRLSHRNNMWPHASASASCLRCPALIWPPHIPASVVPRTLSLPPAVTSLAVSQVAGCAHVMPSPCSQR